MSTVTAYIHAKWDEYDRTWSYSTYSVDMTGYGYIYIMTKDLTFASPTDRELKALLIKNLRLEQEKITAKAHAEKVSIEEKFQSLLALEDRS